jgi:hypothetical protein
MYSRMSFANSALFSHYPVLCVQKVLISSVNVDWQKQGTCTVVDDEPPPPTKEPYVASVGWKKVTDMSATSAGGDFLFPKDQLLLVTGSQYTPLANDDDRLLRNLKKGKSYLVWYHHLFSSTTLMNKVDKAKVANSKSKTKGGKK